MAHVGMTEHGLVEIIDGHTVVLLTIKEAKSLLKEFDRLMKYIEKTERKR